MDINLNEEQEMLRTMARDFLTTECPMTFVKEMVIDERGYTGELWRKMAKVGWMGLPFPEKYGGTEGSFLDLAVLLEEMGYACLPGPFFSTVVLGGMTIMDMGNDNQKQELLSKIIAGDLIITLALTEPSATWDADGITVKATAGNGDYIISGTKLFVPDAHVADYIICVARAEEGITLFLVYAKSPGISYTPLKTIAGDKQCEVVFDNVKLPKGNIIGELGQGWDGLEGVLRKVTVSKCAEMVGGVQRVLDMTVEYAKDRVQFGRPIGSFQVIQHYCANMATSVEACRFVTYEAAWKLDKGLPSIMGVAVAKAYVSEAFRRTAAMSQQIHGAIGFSEDHDLPLYFKKAKASEVMFGDATFHLDKVAHEIGL
ncbi:acyl-CoA dehydrogenase family protein [Candidatus Omnitrophota bacterium]